MRSFTINALTLLVALLADQILSQRLNVFSAQPSFMAAGVFAIALLASPHAAMWTAFSGGLLAGAMTGADYGALVASYGLVAYLLTLLRNLDFEFGTILSAVVIGFATFSSFLLLLVFNPSGGISQTLQLGLKSGVYNIFLALPLYAVLRSAYKKRSSGM